MKKFKHLLGILSLCLATAFCVSACGISEWFGDNLGGGKDMTGKTPTETSDTYTDEIDTVVASLTTTASTTSTSSVPEGATAITSENLEITAEGNYYISGELSLGTSEQIVIKANNVVLYLAGATITSSYSDTNNEGAILVKKGYTGVEIILVDGTENYIATTYSSGTTGMEAICANKETEVSIIGSCESTGGTLTISSTGPSIKSKGEVYVQDANIIASSTYDNCIKGSKSVIFNGATISATAYEAYGCALKADNFAFISSTITATSEDKDAIHAEIDYDTETSAPTFESASAFYSTGGYVYAQNSTITATTTGEGDGIQADTFVKIDGGTVSITTNGGAPSSITESSSNKASGKGIKVGLIDYGEDNTADGEGTDLESDYYCIYISGGSITVNSNDDALHSNGELYIGGGTLNIASGDDGIHADNLIQIYDSPTVTVSKCYEGIEAAKVEISSGTISVTAVDDGINAADGTTTQGSNSNCHIIISGGTTTVDAQGDGVDSNGTILISGGTVYVNGPANGQSDAALDSEGGILVTGGELIAVGSKQMVEVPSTSSTQYVISYSSSSEISSGTTLTLKDSSGNSIISITTKRSCQSIIISSSSLAQGSSYTLYSGSKALSTFTISQIITSIGSQGTDGSFGGSGGMGNNPSMGGK